MKPLAAIIALLATVAGVTYIKPSNVPPALTVAQISHADRAHAGRRESQPAPRATRPATKKSKQQARKRPSQPTTRPTPNPAPRPTPQQAQRPYDSPFCVQARSRAGQLTQAQRDALQAGATEAQRRRYAPCFA